MPPKPSKGRMSVMSREQRISLAEAGGEYRRSTVQPGHDTCPRRSFKPVPSYCFGLAIMGALSLILHLATPRLKTWSDRTTTPAVVCGSTIAFTTLWVGYACKWRAHSILSRVWSGVFFPLFMIGAGTIVAIEFDDDQRCEIIIFKASVYAVAGIMHLINFIMRMVDDEPLIEEEDPSIAPSRGTSTRA